MSGVSKTDYTRVSGGGVGYINLGGWNTTLTACDTTAQEVVGIERREGANTYIYAAQGAQSASSGNLMILATNSADGQSMVPAVTFTQNTAGGTAVQWTVKAMALQTCDSNKYSWYLIKGYSTIRVATNTVSATVLSPICVSEHSAHGWVGAVSWASAQGHALTGIACDVAGGAYIDFTRASL